MEMIKVEDIINTIKSSQEMLIVGFVDKSNIIDNIISLRIKCVLNSLEYKIRMLEYDVELIKNSLEYFSLLTVPTYNIYYNSILLDQFDLLDKSYEIKKKLCALMIN